MIINMITISQNTTDCDIFDYPTSRVDSIMSAYLQYAFTNNRTNLLRISLICAFRNFSRFRTAFDGRRSTQAWLQNLAPFQVFINTSVIQDKTLIIYINVGKFKLEKAPNFVTWGRLFKARLALILG
jgi:hypothetical protein